MFRMVYQSVDAGVTAVFRNGRVFLDYLFDIVRSMIPWMRSGFDEQYHKRMVEAMATLESDAIHSALLSSVANSMDFECPKKDGSGSEALSVDEIRFYVASAVNWQLLKHCELHVDAAKAKKSDANDVSTRALIRYFVDNLIVGGSQKGRHMDEAYVSVKQRSHLELMTKDILKAAREAQEEGSTLAFRTDRGVSGLQMWVVPGEVTILGRKVKNYYGKFLEHTPNSTLADILYQLQPTQALNYIFSTNIYPAFMLNPARKFLDQAAISSKGGSANNHQWMTAFDPLRQYGFWSRPYNLWCLQAVWNPVPILEDGAKPEGAKARMLGLLRDKILDELAIQDMKEAGVDLHEPSSHSYVKESDV